MRFASIHAMESKFLLVDTDGILWFWSNDSAKPAKADFSWNNGEQQKVISVGCNLLRASVLLQSTHYVTFYDQVFSGKKNFCSRRALPIGVGKTGNDLK